MIVPIKETSFRFSDFLSELNQKELVFFLFLTSFEKTDDLRVLFEKHDTMETFTKTLNKGNRKIIRNISTEKMREKLQELYEEMDKATVYRILQGKHENELFDISPNLYAFHCFVHMLFKDRIMQAEARRLEFDYDEHADKWVEEEMAFFEKRFLMPSRHHTNILGLLAFTGYTESYIRKQMDIFDEPEMIFSRQTILVLLLGQQSTLIDKKEMGKLKADNRKLAEQQKKNGKEMKKKKVLVDKLTEQQKTLSVELKEWQKKVKNQDANNQSAPEKTAFYQSLHQTIQKKDEEINQYRKQLDDLQKKPHPIYENMIEKLNEQLFAVKEEAKEKRAEIKQLTKKIADYEAESFLSFAERYFGQYAMNQDIFEWLKNKMDCYEYDQMDQEVSSASVHTEQKGEPLSRIGYALMENGSFSVYFSDNTKMPLTDIPPHIYIGQYQFVLVTGEGSFKWMYSSLYQPEYRQSQTMFVAVSRKEYDEDVRFLDERGRRCHVPNVPNRHHLKNNQVIAVNSRTEFMHYFPNAYVNADVHLNAIKSKGQDAYYVLDVHDSGSLVRHIESGKETFMSLFGEQDFSAGQVVCIEDQEVKRVFHGQFYTLSSYYTKSYHGTVHRQGDILMVKKLSGEMSIIRNIPPRFEFEEGEAITVDEHNQFLRRVQTERSGYVTVESKMMASATAKPDKEKKTADIELSKRALIVGKVTYEESYRTAFAKKGYDVEMVDGYESWKKVKMKTKNQDIIVVVTNFVSHDNMWKIKAGINGVPIIYSENDGANQMAECLTV